MDDGTAIAVVASLATCMRQRRHHPTLKKSMWKRKCHIIIVHDNRLGFLKMSHLVINRPQIRRFKKIMYLIP